VNSLRWSRERSAFNNVLRATFSVIARDFLSTSVADLGEGPGGLSPPPLPTLFWIKKEEITEGRQAKQNWAPP